MNSWRKAMSKRMRAYIDRPSANYNDRKGQAVQFLVLHYTAMATTEAAIERLCDPQSGVSSHYVVGEDGAIYRLVAEDKRAWHAGVSYWDGKTDLNSSSVGIEIANPGDTPFARAQMDAVIALCRDIVKRHGIRAFYVIGHCDIAPDRKQDPGELFAWVELEANNVGVYPSPTQGDFSASSRWTDADLAQRLTKYGYSPTNDLTTTVTAFQRHFQPEVFKQGKAGHADAETKARLACLLRRKAIADGIRASKKSRRRKRA
jgi:N-acetylmuramoyl-L-alanine amidase